MIVVRKNTCSILSSKDPWNKLLADVDGYLSENMVPKEMWWMYMLTLCKKESLFFLTILIKFLILSLKHDSFKQTLKNNSSGYYDELQVVD